MNETRLKMELHKVQREIRIHGTKYNVYRKRLDEYGEDTGQFDIISVVDGLFHATKGYAIENVSEGTRVHSKGQPMLLCLYDGTEDIQNGDFLEINKNKYKIVEKNNIQEYGIVTDISLELILDGRN